MIYKCYLISSMVITPYASPSCKRRLSALNEFIKPLVKMGFFVNSGVVTCIDVLFLIIDKILIRKHE